MKNLMKILAMLTMVGLVTMISCKKDDPTPLSLSAVTANDIDLNGATAPNTVPANAVIKITFTTNVDAATATAANITLTRDFDKANVPVTIATADNVVTITPSASLYSGALYILAVNAGLTSTQGQVITPLTRSFTTAGTFAPDGVIAHWSFENTTNAVVGNFPSSTTLTKEITFADSRNAAAAKAASFNGTTSIIEVPNGEQLMANKDFTLSFWVKASSTKNGHFVMGLAGWKGFQFEIDGAAWTALNKSVKLATQYDLGVISGVATSDSEDTFWNGDGKTKDNGGWSGATFNKNVSTVGVGSFFIDKWAHVVCIYNSTAKVGSMYVNGEKVREWDFKLWPVGAAKIGALGVKFAGNTTGGGNNFAIGFLQASGNRIITDTWADPSNPDNNHFKGLLDDIRVFKKAVTSQEVLLMYNSEK